jgi:hypothetical protein
MNKRTIRVQAAAFDAVEEATKAMRDVAQKSRPRHRWGSWYRAYVVAGAAAGVLAGIAIVWGLHYATVGSCKLAPGASRSTCSTLPGPPRPTRASRH